MDRSSPIEEHISHQDDDVALTKFKNSLRNRRKAEKNYEKIETDVDSYRRMSGSSGSTKGTSNKLAQEIHDEFLTCKICLEGYKSPKSLDCLHTFCEQCIDNHILSECSYKKYADYRDFTCPLCRKHTQLPVGGVKKLPDNFLVANLGEIVAKQRPSKFPFCDICKMVSHKHREAASKCLDCNKLLCKSCVDDHRETKVTKGHSLFDVEIEKEIECKDHPEEVVRFYCEPCETCICVLCTFNEHKDHEITQFSDAVSKYKETIESLLNVCKEKIRVFDEQLDTLGKCDVRIKDSEQRIRDAAIQFISDIRTKERQLIDELHNAYGEELMSYVTRRSEMQVNLDSLKSTCSLTELVLKGKDIELLLLKKQVQQKLSHLSDVKLKDLPTTVCKQIAFFPGTLLLGELNDLNKPGIKTTKSKPIRTLSCNVDHYAENPTVTSISSQTEKITDARPIIKAIKTIGVQTEVEYFSQQQVGFLPNDANTNVSNPKSTAYNNIVDANSRMNSQDSLPPLVRVASQDGSLNGRTQSPTGIRRQRRRRQRPERQEVTTETLTDVEHGVRSEDAPQW